MSVVAHRRLEYQHALRGIAYLRMLAGERSPNTPIGTDRWGNELIPDYPPISHAELEQLKARIEELVLNAARRVGKATVGRRHVRNRRPQQLDGVRDTA